MVTSVQSIAEYRKRVSFDALFVGCRLLHNELLAFLYEDAPGRFLHALAAEIVDGGIVIGGISFGVGASNFSLLSDFLSVPPSH